MVAIIVESLGLKAGDATILSEIALTVSSGEVFGILGPNGAGKTSLMRCLAGEVQAYTGRIEIFNQDLAHWSREGLARRRAVLAQQQSVLFPFAVVQVVALGRYPHRRFEAADGGASVVQAAMTHTGVIHLAGRPYDQLSGGEAQRAQTARALAQILGPPLTDKLLQLDEPTSSLDPKNQHETMHLVRDLASRGLTCICVLHDLNLAASYCDRVALLRAGRIHAIGRVSDVLTPQNIHDVFGIEVDIVHHPRNKGPVIVTLTKGGAS